MSGSSAARVTILCVGDELLVGQVVNTNAAWLGDHLTRLGLMPTRTAVVGDVVTEIVDELQRAFSGSDIVVVTGGLGPTHDDTTRDAVAQYFGAGLILEERWFRLIERRFASRGMTVPERNRVQAMIPEGMEAVRNRHGTAPGLWRLWESDGRTKALAVLPGVPREMKSMMREEVGPRLAPLASTPVHQITIRTTGIGESHLQELLADELRQLPASISVAFLPSPYGVRLRITERLRHGANGGKADELAGRLSDAAGSYVYGRGDDRLETVVGKMLRDATMTVSVAESCTGGAVCSGLTDVPGASAYVIGGVVAYSNSMKEELLGVPRPMIDEHGAVSEEVARAMAEGIRFRSQSDFGLATTGILGPAGGTPEKPVGTVWVACAAEDGIDVRLLRLGKERRANKQRAVAACLDLLRRRLLTAG